MSDSGASAATVQAYRETHFIVHSAEPIVLRLGEANAALLALYRQIPTDCCAYVTACNPRSELLDENANAHRQVRLERDLATQGRRFLTGVGQHPSGDWPGEPSFLILRISREEAQALGARYEQNAIVWCGADGVPALILLRPRRMRGTRSQRHEAGGIA